MCHLCGKLPKTVDFRADPSLFNSTGNVEKTVDCVKQGFCYQKIKMPCHTSGFPHFLPLLSESFPQYFGVRKCQKSHSAYAFFHFSTFSAAPTATTTIYSIIYAFHLSAARMEREREQTNLSGSAFTAWRKERK